MSGNIEEIKELIEQKKYPQLKKNIVDLEEADIASILEELSYEEALKIFRLLPKNLMADVFKYFSIETEQKIITSLTAKEASNIIDNLYADDAADLIEEIPANVVKKILANTTPETRRDINHLLRYPEDSAGSIMTVEFIDLKENYTVEKAIKKIKKEEVDIETIDFCYVLDNERKIIGIVSLRKLIISDSDTLIKDIMDNFTIAIRTLDDQEEVAAKFKKYDYTTMPVVDSEDRLVGIITIDDIIDIIEEETTEDIEKMAAITPSDKTYIKTGVFETWGKRIPWLLLLMISATFTGKIIQVYENSLAAYVVLTSFIPMLMDTGGNAGGQASVTIIRGLSLNEIDFRDIFKIIWKEFRVSILVGITLAITNFIKLIFIDKVTLSVAGVVCFTLIVTVIIAKLVGCTLPILAKKLKFDPAVMASPFITTIVDALSLIIYFQFASLLLGI